ncbi:hypothetical protein DUNSADRAFT_15182 [Dunaliella salina]|uniref:Uncharacterized protein n=1 Tax=Dunaliella salina TaxID=3046 RepID=A0ABQ7G605_DUNSA|nr:hypothetical protein DUNSADRAFT_15182 [Dunaliella salina]|eukprot:KAF5830008.1 hypothetical protein DUNSADRAFT_15182 [Dunaliella salina]
MAARSASNFKKIHYMDDIPGDYRLLTGKEFLENRSACTRVMSDWAICLLTDGKCDGRGYGSKFTPLSRQQREASSVTHERMGEMLIGLDKGGPDLTAFHERTMSRYRDEAAHLDENKLINMFLQYNPTSYKPFVLVSSCPGDWYGGVHTRVKNFCESHKWRFAPVQFEDWQKAGDWMRLWKLQVEEFACRVVADGNVTMLEVKIDGGGPGSAVERSKNMSQWWIDWIKRLGADVFHDLNGRSQTLNGRSQTSLMAPPGCVFIQIGSVIVPEESFTNFTSGRKLDPVKSDKGFHFELHTMVLNGRSRFWVFITEPFVLDAGGNWRRSEIFTSAGTY